MKNRLKVPAGAIPPARAIVASLARKRSVQGLLLNGYPDFWRLWSVGLVVFTVRWLETVAVGAFVYQHSRSAFLVAMMTMLPLLPEADCHNFNLFKIPLIGSETSSGLSTRLRETKGHFAGNGDPHT